MNQDKHEQEAEKVIGLIPRVGKFATKVGLDWFLAALIGMIVLAYLWPEGGIDRKPISLGDAATYGVALIFFFYGLRLSPEKLRAGLGTWKLHIVIQLSTFILFPLLILPLHTFFEGKETELLWLGTFFLAALPSTVSSSVVMVSIANGNIPAAIFNASISSLLGVFITPLWMGLFLTASSGSFDIWSIMGKLVLQVILPVGLGILLNSYWGAAAERHKMKMRYFDQVIILIIVYTSFAESFAQDMFSNYRLMDLVLLGIAMLVLLFLVYGIIQGVNKLLNFSRADSITAVFCGSKKSLVHGTVMSKVLFPDPTMVGIILLPVMLYHALQLLVAGIIAQSLARKEGLVVQGE